MNEAVFRDALQQKRAELLGGSGGRPLQYQMEHNSGRQGDLADQAKAAYDPSGTETYEELKQQVLADLTLVEPVGALLEDPDPAVTDAADWALKRLAAVP